MPFIEPTHLEKIGKPFWRPVGFHLFAMEIGEGEEVFTNFNDRLEEALAPDHVYDASMNIFGPGAAHGPDYADELRERFTARGWTRKDPFAAVDLQPPYAIAIAMVLVPEPSAPRGKAPEVSGQAILPDRFFPFRLDCDLLQGMEMFDPDMDGDYPGPRQAGHRLAEGWSHVPLIFASNSAFGTPDGPLDGPWRFHLEILDQATAGWVIDVDFHVSSR